MNPNPDLFSATMKMLASLGIVLGGMFILFYFSKKFLNKNISGKKETLIRVLSSTYVGVKKSVSLVEIPDGLLVLGVTNDNISLLSKIEDRDVVNRIKAEYDNPQSSFSDHINKLTGKLKPNDKVE